MKKKTKTKTHHIGSQFFNWRGGTIACAWSPKGLAGLEQAGLLEEFEQEQLGRQELLELQHYRRQLEPASPSNQEGEAMNWEGNNEENKVVFAIEKSEQGVASGEAFYDEHETCGCVIRSPRPHTAH